LSTELYTNQQKVYGKQQVMDRQLYIDADLIYYE